MDSALGGEYAPNWTKRGHHSCTSDYSGEFKKSNLTSQSTQVEILRTVEQEFVIGASFVAGEFIPRCLSAKGQDKFRKGRERKLSLKRASHYASGVSASRLLLSSS